MRDKLKYYPFTAEVWEHSNIPNKKSDVAKT